MFTVKTTQQFRLLTLWFECFYLKSSWGSCSCWHWLLSYRCDFDLTIVVWTSLSVDFVVVVSQNEECCWGQCVFAIMCQDSCNSAGSVSLEVDYDKLWWKQSQSWSCEPKWGKLLRAKVSWLLWQCTVSFEVNFPVISLTSTRDNLMAWRGNPHFEVNLLLSAKTRKVAEGTVCLHHGVMTDCTVQCVSWSELSPILFVFLVFIFVWWLMFQCVS